MSERAGGRESLVESVVSRCESSIERTSWWSGVAWKLQGLALSGGSAGAESPVATVALRPGALRGQLSDELLTRSRSATADPSGDSEGSCWI